MSTPNTMITVCHVDFSNDYQHFVYFNTGDEQINYFTAKAVKQFSDYTHIRKNWTLKVNATIAQAEKWNYLFFVQNSKRYFYFITDVKYISDETVELSLEMDVMQTYAFDYTLQPSFVEREHSATDNIGDNTIDEGLELGTYTNVSRTNSSVFNGTMSVLVMTTERLLTEGYDVVTPKIVDGIACGCIIYFFDIATEDGKKNLTSFIKRLNTDGKTDIVLSMWMYPKELVEVDTTGNYPIVTGNKVEGVDFYANIRPLDFDSYVPKNRKLLTYPFTFIYATDNKGSHAIYRYERFDNNAFEFNLEGSAFPDGGVKITPKNYNGIGYNYDESITLTGLPTCAWASDTYKIWLAQNQNQRNTSTLVSAGSMLAGAGLTVAGIMTANPVLAGSGVSMLAGGLIGVSQQVAQQKDAEVQPAQARGASSGTLNASCKRFIDFYQRQITKERAKIIDGYFTMYGYKTQRVKIPNRNVRMYFTFTKTINAHITGELCQDDIRKIQSVYNNGVTFWNKSATIGNYSVANITLSGTSSTEV